MMKKTQWLDARRTIRHRWVSYLSIIVIAMLAVIAYLGIAYAARSLKDSASACFKAQNYADIDLVSTQLLSEDDVDAVREADGVAAAEGVLRIPSRVSSSLDYQDVLLQAGTGEISMPQLLEGSLPAFPEECAVEKALAEKMNWQIGDTFELNGRGLQTDRLIRAGTLKITGIFLTAEHLTAQVQSDLLILVTQDAFRTAMLQGKHFNQIRIRISGNSADRFSAGYEKMLERTENTWKDNPDRIVTDLRDNAHYLFVRSNADNLVNISFSFSLLFIVIAMMVIYSSIGRMVEQDSRLTGAEKAMGLKNSEILGKYLIYGVSSTLAGVLLGILIAYFGLLRFVLMGFSLVFRFEERVYSFLPDQTVFVAAGALIMSAAAVWFGCTRLLRSTAVTLMHGKAPDARKAKSAKRRRGSLYSRLILQNIRNDRKRVLVTVISIAGCCALLMIGFTIRYSISRVLERQYGGIMKYNTEAVLDTAANPAAAEEVSAILAEAGIPHTDADIRSMFTDTESGTVQIRLICTDAGALADYFALTDAETGALLSLPESGVLIPRRLAEVSGLHTGDMLKVYQAGSETREARISGIFENYLDVPVLCSPAALKGIFGDDAARNTLLVRTDGDVPSILTQRLKGVSGFLALSSAETYRPLFESFTTILNLVVLLMILLAVMIACFILLNLVNTYVMNKKQELTIMRINGFTARETIRYASLESYGTTLAGIPLGIAVGWIIASAARSGLDQPFIQFCRDPHWVPFAASAIITLLISGTIHMVSFRKIRTLKLSDLQRQ